MTRFCSTVCLLVSLFAFGGGALSQEIQTKARQAILIDAETGGILLEKDADLRMPPASMSKLMTVLMVFERLKEGSLSLDDTFTVSEKAWKFGGSKMFVMVNDQIKVEDLLRGIIVQSGNDSCIVVAEGLMGSEDAFAEAMTAFGKEIGLTNSTFANSTGWPHPEHRTTPHDLAMIALKLINDHGDLYPIFAETEFTWSDIKQGNRNPLLYRNMGADGLKTGHTEEAGYGLVGSAVRDGRRLILVVAGLDSVKDRSIESQRLLEWGFRTFDNYELLTDQQVVDQADVWLGDKGSVPLVVEQGLTLTLPKAAARKLDVKVSYDSPIPAPIAKGQVIGNVTISAPDMDTIEMPVKAGGSVEQLGMVGRLSAALKYLLWGQGADL